MFTEKTIRVYEDLADHFNRQKDARQRDACLVLAADAAYALGRPDHAERLRLRLLKESPHSLLKPYSSFGEARKAPDIQLFLEDLRNQYPPHEAEKLLGNKRGGSSAREEPKGYQLLAEPAKPKPVPNPWSRTTETKAKPKPSKPFSAETPLDEDDEDEEESTPGSWFAALLFILILLLTLGFLGYSLFPFLQP